VTAPDDAAPTADELLERATDVPFRGWNFTLLGDRLTLEPPPWSLEAMVAELVEPGTTMLDMGTGGGEWLSGLARSSRVVATESWSPNVPVAAARLQPLGIAVVRDEGAADNVDQERQDRQDRRGRLAFRAGVFDLVVNRHEAFVPDEVGRILRAGGVFLTQQATTGSAEFHRLLGLDPPIVEELTLALVVDQLTRAGFDIEGTGEGVATTTFSDIGALAWYLSNVPWAVPGFSIPRCRNALIRLHGHPIRVPSTRFWVRARAQAQARR
jgi:SAM-dependent methyltransferase